jgi:hypothetical protein
VTQAALLPDLFGRFTVVMREHRDLRHTVADIRRMCAAIEDKQELSGGSRLPASLLGELQSDLTEHFAMEKGEAYFGTLVAEVPALDSRIAELKLEHSLMLHGIGVLCALAGDRGRWPELPRPTRELLSLIERHERAESQLLGEFFGK